MSRRRWIADEFHDNTAALTGEHAFHLARVLRAQVGQQFDISIGNAVRRGTITSISDIRVEFALGQVEKPRPAPSITLVLAIFKFDRMEWAIEKCTEIGVARIIPLVARRTEARLATAAVKRRERWERIALQASEQSRRTAPPEIAGPTRLAQLATLLVAGETPALPGNAHATADLRIVLAESEANTLLSDVVETRLAASRPEAPQLSTPEPMLYRPQLTLAIGPAGGWTDDEFQWFRDAGWPFSSLGDTILRAETAAIVACAIAMDCLRRQ